MLYFEKKGLRSVSESNALDFEILKFDFQHSENANMNSLNKMLDKLINLKEFELNCNK